MATIYRFIVEQKTTSSGGGRKDSSSVPKKTTAKKGRYVSIFGGQKGGVEHNRKMRAFNHFLNLGTHGYYEKGMRLGRAGFGLITRNTATGAFGVSPVAVAIIVAMAIQLVLKLQARDRARADKLNNQNYKMLENGSSAIRGAYSISVDMWSGAHTYNQNK